MIAAKELRIGNLMGFGNNFHTVNAIYLSHFTATDLNGVQHNSAQYNLSPIPLTADILERVDINQLKRIADILEIFESAPFVKVKAWSLVVKHTKHPLKYVHNLQNFYIENTGEELTINLLSESVK